MQPRFAILFMSTALIASSLPAQQALTRDELVSKNVEAKGGAEALRALQSLRLTGKMLVNEGQLELGFVQTKKQPNRVRDEASLQGMTRIQAYDG